MCMKLALEFHFPNNKGMSEIIFICIYYYLLHVCVHSYPLTAHYVPYSCQWEYLLKYNIYSYLSYVTKSAQVPGTYFLTFSLYISLFVGTIYHYLKGYTWLFLIGIII